VLIAWQAKCKSSSYPEFSFWTSCSCASYAGLVALHVVEVPLATPIETEDEILDHPGKGVLAAAARVAEKSSKKLSTELLRAREAGEAVVGEAKDRGAELLIVGDRGSHPSAVGELVLGSTAQYAGHHAPCRVIIQIPLPEPAIGEFQLR